MLVKLLSRHRWFMPRCFGKQTRMGRIESSLL
jgi:hypothetical protein